MIRSAKESYFYKYISNCNGDQKKLFNISLLCKNNQTVFLYSFNSFFTDNILDIRTNFTEVELPVCHFDSANVE